MNELIKHKQTEMKEERKKEKYCIKPKLIDKKMAEMSDDVRANRQKNEENIKR